MTRGLGKILATLQYNLYTKSCIRSVSILFCICISDRFSLIELIGYLPSASEQAASVFLKVVVPLGDQGYIGGCAVYMNSATTAFHKLLHLHLCSSHFVCAQARAALFLCLGCWRGLC